MVLNFVNVSVYILRYDNVINVIVVTILCIRYRINVVDSVLVQNALVERVYIDVMNVMLVKICIVLA